MTVKKERFFALAAGLVLFAAVFVFPREFSQGAATGLKNSAGIIVPSLFPFMVAASLLGEGEIPPFLKKLLDPVMKKLFGQPAESAVAVFIGLFGGYPSGTRAAASLYESGKINKSQAESLMLFCVNAGTGFCINALGSSLLKSERAGGIIFASLCVSALIAGFFSRPESAETEKKSVERGGKAFSKIFVESVASGASGIITVSALATLFSGLITVFSVFLPNEKTAIAVSCLLEITSGCASAAGKLPLPLIASACAFGGMCVHMQIFASAGKLKPDWKKFLLFRLIHSAFSGAACALLLRIFPVAVQTSVPLTDGAELFSFSMPAALSLLFFSSLLIFDLDKQRKIC